jgi:cephalosporin hydroxylase
MKPNTRLKVARIVRFFRPPAQKLSVTVDQILSNSESLTTVERFNKLFYDSGVAGTLNWRGVPMIKTPCDLWMILELLQAVRPTVLVETGTHHGASALYFAEMMNLLGSPVKVITIDINPKWQLDPDQFGIDSIVGYSTDPAVICKVNAAVSKALKNKPGPVMVTLDSDHSEQNVTNELEIYSPLVTPNSYLIVEDTNINGHPASPGSGPGPWEAVEKFLSRHPEFARDRNCERYMVTFFPGGWLRRSSMEHGDAK